MRLWLAVALLLGGCEQVPVARETPGIPPPPPDLLGAPTYTDLYNNYFGPNTPGHCGNSDCHLGTPRVHVWVCGSTRDTCYAGMVKVGIISTTDPTNSPIADPQNSPLSWINPNGPMPRDNPTPNPQAGGDIVWWVLAGAQNN
jgi:hypothetical protein